MTFTLTQARRLALHHQGLGKPDQFGRGIKAVERAILAIRYVQIDTISVVNRAHHHVLQSRVSNYQEDWLNRLLTERKIFEYWHHAAAYMPIEDYRFYRPMMVGFGKTRETDKQVAKEVIARIKAEGPLQSKDFAAPPLNKNSKKAEGWWNWKPAKMALEHLFLSGELMVSERRGFQKVFDLTERVLPADIETSKPSDSERGHFLVDQMLNAQGVGRPQDIAYMKEAVRRFEKFYVMPHVEQALAEQVESGDVVASQINGETYYAKQKALDDMPKRLGKRRVQILSPFDNIIINRNKLENLFDFQYQIECYVPEPKRQFGYFTLPMLLGDKFVGRIDCKAHRDKGKLAINNVWLEDHIQTPDDLCEQVADAVKIFAADHNCEEIELINCSDKSLKKPLKSALA